jgi:hypothetical protein
MTQTKTSQSHYRRIGWEQRRKNPSQSQNSTTKTTLYKTGNIMSALPSKEIYKLERHKTIQSYNPTQPVNTFKNTHNCPQPSQVYHNTPKFSQQYGNPLLFPPAPLPQPVSRIPFHLNLTLNQTQYSNHI